MKFNMPTILALIVLWILLGFLFYTFVLTVGLSESYAPSLLPPVVLLAFLDDPLPLGLNLIRSLPHAAGTSIDLTA
jgi:hypothetical protein